MWIVFLLFFSVYGSMHAYLYYKMQVAFPRALRWRLPLGAFLLLMVFATVIIRFFEYRGWVRVAEWFGAVGFTWVAMILWFCSICLPLDLWNGLCRLGGRLWAPARRAMLPTRAAVTAAWILIAALSVWGVIEADRVRVREIRIRTPCLAPGSRPLRIVHVSDLHIGRHRTEAFFRRVIAAMADLKADILISTGDLIDTRYDLAPAVAPLLRDIRPPMGKYAILGNHEYYVGLDGSLKFHEDAGFRMLRGAVAEPVKGLCIAGVDDPAGHHMGKPSMDSEAAALDAVPAGSFVVFLKHQPRVEAASVGRFDIQLSGHVHGGQIFPFQAAVRLMYPFCAGMHRLGDRSLLYVSRGAGTWGPSMRVLARPEIALLVIEPAP